MTPSQTMGREGNKIKGEKVEKEGNTMATMNGEAKYRKTENASGS